MCPLKYCKSFSLSSPSSFPKFILTSQKETDRIYNKAQRETGMEGMSVCGFVFMYSFAKACGRHGTGWLSLRAKPIDGTKPPPGSLTWQIAMFALSLCPYVTLCDCELM